MEYLTFDDLILIHADMIRCYGGSPTLRDEAIARRVIDSARATFDQRPLNPDPISLAAAYLLGIVAGHPFVDGNKRTGAAAAIIALRLNGLRLTATEDQLADFVLDVAQGRADKASVIAFLTHHTRAEGP